MKVLKKRMHPVREKILVGLVFLAALFAIVFLLHELWEALARPAN